jgi:WD40 repeat protein
MKVFLSSTYLDLVDYRKAAAEALDRLGQQAGRMEVFGARPEEPLMACLREIEDCDLFVGIYAHRYGYIPDASDTSITEAEYRQARKCNKPIFCFIVDDEYPWPPKMIDDEPGRSKLKEFKKEISKGLVKDTFTTPENIAYKIATSIGRLLTQSPFTSGPAAGMDISGRWRADETETQPLMYFEFKVVGDKLFGTVWIPPSHGMPNGESTIHNGLIVGDRVSFTTKHVHADYFVRGETHTRNEIIASYQGQIKGDEIHFARQVNDRYSEIRVRRVVDLTETVIKEPFPKEENAYVLVYTLPGHEGGVKSLSFGPTQGTYRSGGIRLVSGGSKDGKANFWDTATAESWDSSDIFSLSEGGGEIHVAYSPKVRERGVDLSSVGVSKDRRRIRFIESYFPLIGGHGGGRSGVDSFGVVGPLCIGGNSAGVATAENSGTPESTVICIRNNYPGTIKHSLQCKCYVSALALSNEGKLLVSAEISGSGETVVKLGETATGTNRWRTSSCQPISCLAASPEGDLIASGGAEDGQVRIWDAGNGSLKLTLVQKGDSRISALAFSHAGSLLATAGFPSGVISLWNTGTGELVQAANGESNVGVLAFSRDDRLLASGDAEIGFIKVWAKPKLPT